MHFQQEHFEPWNTAEDKISVFGDLKTQIDGVVIVEGRGVGIIKFVIKGTRVTYL